MPGVKGPFISVRTKLIGLALGTSLLALMLACTGFVLYDRSSFAEAKQKTLSVLVASVAQSAFGPTAFQDDGSANVILKVLEAEPSAKGGAIYTAEGARLSVWARDGYESSLPATWPKSGAPRDGYALGELKLAREIANAEQKVGTLHVVFSSRDLELRTQRFLEISLLVLVVSAAAGLALALVAQRVITRPVQLLAEAAHRVEVEQDFHVRVPRVSNDELGQLTAAFNGMLQKIQARDEELNRHRAHLEDLVGERTRDLDQKNREMRLVLDNVDQGLVIVSREGALTGERSAILERWFGQVAEGDSLASYLGRVQHGLASSLQMSWDQLVEDVLPMELNLAQMPGTLCDGARHYELAYRPIAESERSFDKMLLVVSDVTEHVERERSEAEQAETLAMFEQISLDRSGFSEFFEETQATMARLLSPEPRDVTLVLRELHTLKGNLGLFGLKTMARTVHTLEDECLPERLPLDDAQRARLGAAWHALERRARSFLGEGGRALTIDPSELAELERAIGRGAERAELSRLARRLGMEPVAGRLLRLGERAKRLAERLDKAPLDVVVEADGVKASPELAWLWHVLPHVVANAVDHGIVPSAERAAAGRSGPAQLRLCARPERDHLVIEVSDDGRGIDWEGLLRKARTLGLPANSNADAEQALFADGVTTRDTASDVSGRGIGMAAVKSACDEHGARLRVLSEAGRGTTFRFELHEEAAYGRRASLPRASLSA
jgi:two-component system, chemotaxis family, sensor kinase CheA